MHVTMHTIPHDQQRYDTVGDWHFDMNGDLIIKVSKMSDPRYETLIAVHELIEAVLCKQAGVSEDAVDAFDMAYEAGRKVRLDKARSVNREPVHGRSFQGWRKRHAAEIAEIEEAEPGDDPQAPYHHQHMAASMFEEDLAKRLGVDWEVYAAEVMSK